MQTENSNGIIVDNRWQRCGGIGRYSTEILSRLQYNTELPRSINRLTALEPLKISLFLRKNKCKVYYSPSFIPGLFPFKNTLLTIHDLIHLKIPEEQSLLKSIFYRLLVKPSIQRARHVFTVSEYSKKEIVRWANIDPNKVIVAPNGVDAKFTPSGDIYKPGFPYFFYVGNRKPHKNIEGLIKSFSDANLPNDVCLLLSGEAEQTTVQYAKKYKVIDRIKFSGLIPDDKLPSYYRGAIALIFPSFLEGFGLPALESMACGTPVVASNISSLPEVVGEAAILIDPYDTDTITNGIRSLFADSELRKTLANKGIKQASKFSWDQSATIVQNTINHILKSI